MLKDTIFVTGSNGLIGSHLLYKLVSAGYKAKALVRSLSNQNAVKKVFEYYSESADELFKKIEWVEGDVLDYFRLVDLLENVKQVYHAAALVSFRPKDKAQMMNVNIKGTANIVNACIECGVEKLCHVSSVAALGHAEDGSAIDENTPWKSTAGNSSYSIGKFFAETEIWRGIEEGLKAVIVNPTVVLGPGNWHRGSSAIMTEIHNGLSFYTAGSTGYVDVRDVSEIMIRLMNSDISGERFLLNSENVYFKDSFAMMSHALGLKTKWKEAKPWMTNIAWRYEKIKSLFTGISPRITKEIVSMGSHLTFYSNEKIKKTLNPQFIPVEDSIKYMAEFFGK